jgi:hypothetical protein
MLLLLAYLAHSGGLRVGRVEGQYRAWLTKPWGLLAACVTWLLLDWLYNHFIHLP